MDLSNKKILFFAPSFFGYDNEIKKELEKRGAQVILYNERPSTNFLIKTIIRLNKKFIYFYTLRYFNKIIKTNAYTAFDYVFIIKGEVFTREIVSNFKENYPQAKFILYLWDSIKNYIDIKNALNLFDKTSTFDIEDSKEIESLKFRPLFFANDYLNLPLISSLATKPKYDLLFIGTVHSDRWEFLSKLKKEAEKNNLNVFYYLYIQSPIIFFFRKLLDKRLRSLPLRDIQFYPLTIDKICRLVEQSVAILDIQHPKQTGLTMRSIEVLGANRKLITSNTSISNYDFYHQNNVLIVDRKNPKLPETFFNLPYIEIDQKIYTKYSIEGWISDIFSE
jgi:hypothetical protein